MRPIIEIRGACKRYGDVTALADVDLCVEEGEIVTLLGPSGCGKTTLMRLIAGFEQLSAGALAIDGKDTARLSPERRPVNMVFQRYALFPHLDVFDNVAFGLRVKRLPRDTVRERVQRILGIVQLEGLADRRIDELSGGQCQRVALARALVNEPKVLLLDEPLAALDLKIRQHMLVEMKRIHQVTGATFIYVTHDQEEAMVLSDRVVLMNKGRIVQVDPPETMYARPRSLFAARFLGETNLIEAQIVGTEAGEVTLRSLGGLEFRVAANGLPATDRLVISVRPEALAFEPGASGAGARSVRGAVEDIVFTGSRSFYTLRLDDGAMLRVQAQNSPHAVLPRRGESIDVYWSPDSLVLLPP